MNQRTCKACSTTFHPTHSRQVYCNPECRQDEHRKAKVNCDSCGQTCLKEVRARRYAATYCSQLCRDYVRTEGRGSTCKIPSDHMARCIGQTCRWSPPPQEAVTRHIPCQWCGTTFTSVRPTALYCTPRCKQKVKKSARRAREYGAMGTYTWADITRLWLLFDKRCAYCTRRTPLADIQAEHVQPLSRQGANNLSNLLPSCGPCNGDKRDLLLTDWPADRARRGLPSVTTTWADDDERYKHLVISSPSLIAA